jgi:DNA-binding LytR/AlgR family response regulator
MKNNDPLSLRINTETSLKTNSIVYMQSAANYTCIHTTDRQFLSSRTLKVLNSRLLSGEFVKVRRGLIVNSIYITEINKDKFNPFIQLISGKRFAISRRMYEQVVGKM